MIDGNEERMILMFSAFVMTGLFMTSGQRTEDVAEGGGLASIEVAGHINTIASHDTEVVVIDNDNGIPEVTNLG